MDVFRTNFIVDCRCHTIVDRTQTAVHKIKMEGGLFQNVYYDSVAAQTFLVNMPG